MNSDSSQGIVSPALHRAIVTRVRATTLRQLMEQIGTQVVPQLLSVAVIAGLSWQSATRLHLALWVGTQLAVVYLPELYLYFYARRRPMSDERLARWEHVFRLCVFLNSAYFA